MTAGSERTTLRGHDGPVRDCAFSPDGSLLATAGADGTARLWDVAAGRERAVLRGHQEEVGQCAFSPDGRLLATASPDHTARLWDITQGTERATLRGHEGFVTDCAFSPDGSLLATSGTDRLTRLWDVAAATERATLRSHDRLMVGRCVFSADRRLLATASGLSTTRIWEEVEPPSHLPAVVPDAVGGVDCLGVGADAAALANVIAAKETRPPLSIGLFGDWGSGKSFLIGEVQQRIRQISRRARGAERSAYCAHVRNVEFNAWHYADANLWASLVTHIFDELAKPEPGAGVSDERAAQAQLARLEDELASKSALREHLARAQDHTRRAEARRRLMRLTWRLAGAEDEEQSLGELQSALDSVRGAAKLLLPSARARVAVLGLVAAIAVIAVGVAALLGAGGVFRLIAAAGAGLTTAVGWFEIGRRYVAGLLKRAGETARVVDIRSTPIDAEVDAAREAEHRLRRELADLKSGRRLARFATERGASDDYRAHLGLVSRIHDDFVRMSEILASPRTPTAAEAGSEADDSDLPTIDRIVLYIDDLDRCPPRRVVEVLEAVHLILAVPLFVVVIAVDPRWLLQSLRLHYSELLAAGLDESEYGSKQARTAPRRAADEDAWRSTPVHYLEKIIQVPFALRPMGPGGVRSLVHGLLPVEVAAEQADERLPVAEGEPPTDALAAGDGTPPAEAQPEVPGVGRERAAPAPRAPSLSPRTLALTEAERDFAVTVAAALHTPRTVKKFTNLYRLLRAGLDEHSGALDRFLADDAGDAPEYQTVLILLATIIAFPEEASDVLLALGDLAPDAPPDRRAWSELVAGLRTKGTRFAEVARFLEEAIPEGREWTCDPFRRWALAVSRYSFATGQEVFSGTQAGGRSPISTSRSASATSQKHCDTPHSPLGSGDGR